jgi:hypothetical protein
MQHQGEIKGHQRKSRRDQGEIKGVTNTRSAPSERCPSERTTRRSRCSKLSHVDRYLPYSLLGQNRAKQSRPIIRQRLDGGCILYGLIR